MSPPDEYSKPYLLFLMQADYTKLVVSIDARVTAPSFSTLVSDTTPATLNLGLDADVNGFHIQGEGQALFEGHDLTEWYIEIRHKGGYYLGFEHLQFTPEIIGTAEKSKTRLSLTLFYAHPEPLQFGPIILDAANDRETFPGPALYINYTKYTQVSCTTSGTLRSGGNYRITGVGSRALQEDDDDDDDENSDLEGCSLEARDKPQKALVVTMRAKLRFAALEGFPGLNINLTLAKDGDNSTTGTIYGRNEIYSLGDLKFGNFTGMVRRRQYNRDRPPKRRAGTGCCTRAT